MFKLQNLSFLISFFLMFINLFTVSSCKENNEARAQAIDTLKMVLHQTELALEIDYPTIANRKKLIESHRRWVDRFYKKDMAPEVGMMLAKYKGIQKVYGQFVDNFESTAKTYMSLVKEVEHLQEQGKDGNISNSKFKESYVDLKERIGANYKQAQFISSNVLILEPDYQRISSRMDSELRMIAESDTLLKRILDDEEKSQK